MGTDQTPKYNITLIGKSAVGKTSIANALLSKEFSDDYTATVGAYVMKFESNSNSVEFNIWDTAGQEKFKALAPVYYRDSDAALVVYSVVDESSFTELDEWCRKYIHERPASPIIILANKIDIQQQAENAVPDIIHRGKEYAESKNYQFLEVSAKTNQGIGEILPILIKVLKNKIPASIEKKNLDKTQPQGKCC